MTKTHPTSTEARTAARDLVSYLQDRQWSLATVAHSLPRGWVLRDVEDRDFHPLTITNVAEVLRRHVMIES